MTGCDELRPLLDLAPLGLLEGDERARHDAHVAGCDACRTVAEAVAGHHAADEAAVERELAGLQVADLRPQDRPVFEARKKPAPAGPAVDAARVEAVGRRIALSCSFCHDRVPREQVAFCASCVAPHHAECFAQHGRCALPGCAETSTVRPQGTPRRSRRGGELVALVLAAGVGLGAAAWTSTRSLTAPGAAELATALAHERALRSAVGEEDRGRADEALAGLEEACAAAEEADPALATRVATLREAARTARRSLDVARTSIDVSGEDVADVVERLGRQVGRNILVDPQVRETVTLSLRDMRWPEILRTIATRARCRIVERAGGVLVLVQPPAVTIQFTDANIRTVLQLLAAYSGKNVVIQPDVQGSVTLDLKEVPWDEALVALARANGLFVTLYDGGIVLVSTTPKSEGTPLVVERQDWSEDAPPYAAADGALIDVVADHLLVTEVVASIARQSGRRIVAQGCADRRVTLDVRRVTWRAAVEALAVMARLDAQTRDGGELLLTPTSTSLLVANGARGSTWAQLLATAAGVRLVIPPQAAEAVVTKRLTNVDPLQALQGLARDLGWNLLSRDSGLLLELVPYEGWRGVARGAPPPLTLQATVMTPQGSWAIISDRVLARGAALVGEDGLPVQGTALVEVSDGEVAIQRSLGRVERLRFAAAR